VPFAHPTSGSGRIIRTIALIDDDNDDEFFLRRVLKKGNIGGNILRFHDGQEGIAYFERQGRYADKKAYPDADLVFLDINMPLATGFDVLRWAQAHPAVLSPCLVVMLTSSSKPKDRSDSIELGVAEYAIKPPTTELFEQLADKYAFHWQFQKL
jgi:CheY-like chemotaxis protein